jgi:hypothetical protein
MFSSFKRSYLFGYISFYKPEIPPKIPKLPYCYSPVIDKRLLLSRSVKSTCAKNSELKLPSIINPPNSLF